MIQKIVSALYFTVWECNGATELASRNVPYNKWNNPYNKGTDNIYLRCKNSNNGTNALLGTTFSNTLYVSKE